MPEQWLQDREARAAYALRLPGQIPVSVPFDFNAAKRQAWLPGAKSVAVQYFEHLCSTEAGEWILRTVKNVEGLYFARPQRGPTADVMKNPYGPEMPWIQRRFMLQADTLHDQGAAFVQPPFYNYRFVEQPRREVAWQSGIREPYIRLFGHSLERATGPNGALTTHFKQNQAMQILGVYEPSSRYGYTWRAIRRPRDRELGISGGELLIYDRKTKEVLAVRRQFLIAARSAREVGKVLWEVAESCRQLQAHPDVGEFSQFAFDVLLTIEPSSTRRR